MISELRHRRSGKLISSAPVNPVAAIAVVHQLESRNRRRYVEGNYSKHEILQIEVIPKPREQFLLVSRLNFINCFVYFTFTLNFSAKHGKSPPTSLILLLNNNESHP